MQLSNIACCAKYFHGTLGAWGKVFSQHIEFQQTFVIELLLFSSTHKKHLMRGAQFIPCTLYTPAGCLQNKLSYIPTTFSQHTYYIIVTFPAQLGEYFPTIVYIFIYTNHLLYMSMIIHRYTGSTVEVCQAKGVLWIFVIYCSQVWYKYWKYRCISTFFTFGSIGIDNLKKFLICRYLDI